MDLQKMKQKAHELLGIGQDAPVYFAPGRINLIGEHLDYNGGHVLPCTLDLGTYGTIVRRNDRNIVCYSENDPDTGVVTVSLDHLVYQKEHNWVNYVKGVLRQMKIATGFSFYVQGDLPLSSGLSSSAALEILTAYAINDLYQLQYELLDLVHFAHHAETDFMGVNCGIMDQFVIAMAKAGQVLLLNTANLEYSPVAWQPEHLTLIIGNTKKTRTLSASKYNERHDECLQALRLLQKKLNIQNLCDLSSRDLVQYGKYLKDDLLFRRCQHVVTENERTQRAFTALVHRNYPEFGELLNASHKSLKQDYEVTGFELDTMTELFRKSGALGSRMTGAGFGGCAIALVQIKKTEEVIARVKEEYMKLTGLTPEFYPVNVGSGVRRL